MDADHYAMEEGKGGEVAGGPQFAEEGEFGHAGYGDYAPTTADSFSDAGLLPQGSYVVVEHAGERKPYLGGVRDTRTGIVYHDAYTATSDARIRPHKWAGVAPGSRIERDTQTSKVVTRSIQSQREAGAQTERRDLHHDAVRDREVHPREYITSEQVMETRGAKAVVIQCAIRCALARSLSSRLSLERDTYKAKVVEDAERAQEARAAHAARDKARRASPRSQEDFAVLYDEIEDWRLAETARIDVESLDARRALEAVHLPPLATAHGPMLHDQRVKDLSVLANDRRLAMLAMAKQEQVLVARIERMRLGASKANAASRVERELAAMATPRHWPCTDGAHESVAVTTPFAARAGQLKELHDGLLSSESAQPGGAHDATARMDILLHVKYTVREFDSALTREISSLVDREVDLLERRRPSGSLSGLRARIRSAFITFCETPEFNPEAARFSRVPGGPLGVLGGTANVTGSRGKGGGGGGGEAWATMSAAAAADALPVSTARVVHPYYGTVRDPRLLSIPSFMRPTLKK